MQAALLTDTVEDNHVIVDGVTDDGKDSGDERLVNIQVERKDTVEQGEEANHDEGGVSQGDNTTETPGPALEADGDVAEDHDEGQEYGDECAAGDIAGDGRTNLVGGDDTVGVLQRGGEV